MSRELDVMYQLGKGAKTPTQGYEDDFAYDLYAAEGVLVPPLTFKSVVVPTNLKTAFDPVEAGMHLAIRSGAAFNTPLILSNAPAVIEGTYRDGINILVRNSFIDNHLVDFVFNIKGEKVPLSSIPKKVVSAAKKFYESETDQLGYEGTPSGVLDVAYVTQVPRGTIYIEEGDRIAQMFFAPKYKANLEEKKGTLPKSVRGTAKHGSSGTK